jgi:hypothetical protein
VDGFFIHPAKSFLTVLAPTSTTVQFISEDFGVCGTAGEDRITVWQNVRSPKSGMGV